MAPAKGLDAMKPTSADEFTEFGTALKDKITQFQVSVTQFTSLVQYVYTTGSSLHNVCL